MKAEWGPEERAIYYDVLADMLGVPRGDVGAIQEAYSRTLPPAPKVPPPPPRGASAMTLILFSDIMRQHQRESEKWIEETGRAVLAFRMDAQEATEAAIAERNRRRRRRFSALEDTVQVGCRIARRWLGIGSRTPDER